MFVSEIQIIMIGLFIIILNIINQLLFKETFVEFSENEHISDFDKLDVLYKHKNQLLIIISFFILQIGYYIFLFKNEIWILFFPILFSMILIGKNMYLKIIRLCIIVGFHVYFILNYFEYII